MEVTERFGKQFVDNVDTLLIYRGTNVPQKSKYPYRSKLMELLTKRSIVRYISMTLDVSGFDEFEKNLWDELKSEASKEPIVYKNPTGVFVNGDKIDTVKIFTDDPEKIYGILKNGEYTKVDEFLVKKEVIEHSPEWYIRGVENYRYVDVYYPGGTSEHWHTRASNDGLERYYGMTYIPDLLWCYTPLYDQALKRTRSDDDL
jgi:hypothetical protein